LVKKKRDILLSFRHKGFLIARASAKRNDYRLFASGRCRSESGSKAEQSGCARACAGYGPQKITPAYRYGFRNLSICLDVPVLTRMV
jgi:hypothetical protein